MYNNIIVRSVAKNLQYKVKVRLRNLQDNIPLQNNYYWINDADDNKSLLLPPLLFVVFILQMFRHLELNKNYKNTEKYPILTHGIITFQLRFEYEIRVHFWMGFFRKKNIYSLKERVSIVKKLSIEVFHGSNVSFKRNVLISTKFSSIFSEFSFFQ